MQSNQNSDKTPIAVELEARFKLMGVEVLHENYSCTIDFQREISPSYQTQLERKGYEVIHEQNTIYTLKLK